MSKTKSEFVAISLGTVLVSRAFMERAKEICGYTRHDIKQIIIQHGEESLANAVDMGDYCKHGLAASEGICRQCERGE